MRDKRQSFIWLAGRPALDLCNTRTGAVDRLSDPSDLAAWLVEAGLAPYSPAVSLDELAAARGLRERLHETMLAADRRGVARVAADWLSASRGRMCVDEETLWLTFVPDATSAYCLMTPVVMDALELARDLLGRVRVCAAERCELIYLDTSRNRSRRWCSMERCGARAKAVAYYRRHRGAGDGGPSPLSAAR